MQVALAAIRDAQGGVCVVADGKVVAMVALPIAGLLSTSGSPRSPQTRALKETWTAAGCTIPYGLQPHPISVIPEIRITDRDSSSCPR